MALLLAACAGEEPDSFVAFQRDFEGYRSWRTIDVAEADLPGFGHGTGDRTIHVSDGRRGDLFPVGTRIVKVLRAGDDPTAWPVVAMAKRGGDYNDDGALGWEWFELHLDEAERPAIVWRGEEPPAGRGYACFLGGDDDTPQGPTDCNVCHRAAADEDYVLSPQLAIR